MKQMQDRTKLINNFHVVLNHNISAWSQYAIHLKEYIQDITSEKIANILDHHISRTEIY